MRINYLDFLGLILYNILMVLQRRFQFLVPLQKSFAQFSGQLKVWKMIRISEYPIIKRIQLVDQKKYTEVNRSDFNVNQLITYRISNKNILSLWSNCQQLIRNKTNASSITLLEGINRNKRQRCGVNKTIDKKIHEWLTLLCFLKVDISIHNTFETGFRNCPRLLIKLCINIMGN